MEHLSQITVGHSITMYMITYHRTLRKEYLMFNNLPEVHC